ERAWCRLSCARRRATIAIGLPDASKQRFRPAACVAGATNAATAPESSSAAEMRARNLTSAVIDDVLRKLQRVHALLHQQSSRGLSEVCDSRRPQFEPRRIWVAKRC